MSKVQLVPEVFWVGAVDWNVRNFHGYTYSTKRGTTYNSYLINDEKIALVDTVYEPFSADMINKIKEIVSPEKISYVIANHVEKDHSGALPEIMKYCPNAKVVGTEKCKEGLYKYYYKEWDFQIVKTGDEIKLGKKTLTFVEAPMVHWPDSMFTYIKEDALLMPNDAFGQHIASSQRFNDEVDQCELMEEAKIYYANILIPLGSIIERKLEEVIKMNIPINMIAPSHGVIWRNDPMQIVKAYESWTKNETKQKAVIVYETMWGSTEKMAEKIYEGLNIENIDVKLYDINKADSTEIIKEILDAKAVIIGSSTHDNGMLPNIAGFLEFLKGLKPKKRIGGAFGSYGWAGGAVKEVEEVLKKAGFNLEVPAVDAKFVPDEGELKKCYEYGRMFAEKIGG